MPSRRLLIVVNDPAFLVSHRLPIALAAQRAGYKVHVATANGLAVGIIKECGLTHHAVPLNRSGANPIAEIRSVISLFQLFRRLQPDVVHLVTIKPVLYGGIAARLAGVKSVVAAIPGLGVLFTDGERGSRVARSVVPPLYRSALGHRNLHVICQNPDDRETLIEMRATTRDKVSLIRGSGVALDEYPVTPEPPGAPYVVSFAARLLRTKGLGEFVEAARLLFNRGLPARFQVIGAPDPGNPSSVTREELERWQDEPNLDLIGFRDNIPQVFAASHIVVLPSYREGLPKVLLEAAACGRAVITTDVPGCRDAIEPGITGLLVPPRDATALADAIETLLLDSAQRRSMGRAGRILAEREFAIEKIAQQHLDVYRKVEMSST